MSDHIERRVIAPNVDPTRTHLNRELVRMPEGIRERDDAIAARISSAGIYNPQNEMFRLLGTKRSFSQNETFFFSHPYPLYPALFRLISHF